MSGLRVDCLRELAVIDRLRATVQRLTNVNGSIAVRQRHGTHAIWQLRYAKAESIRLLRWMYHAPDVPCLDRKRAKAEKFLRALGRAQERPTGRPRVGWLYNVKSENSLTLT